MAFPLFFTGEDVSLEDAILRKISRLAELEPSRDELEKLGPEFQRMTGFFGMLEELDTDGVEPLVQLTGEEGLAKDAEGRNVFREDEVTAWETPGELLAGAPEREGDFFAVPRTYS